MVHETIPHEPSRGCLRTSGSRFLGTFQLTAEAIDQPLADLNRARAENGIPEVEFVTLHEGETRIFRTNSP
jgi:creatinine amidohydrolase/Fe(II)-dependent formamide hydrolase-like protein